MYTPADRLDRRLEVASPWSPLKALPERDALALVPVLGRFFSTALSRLKIFNGERTGFENRNMPLTKAIKGAKAHLVRSTMWITWYAEQRAPGNAV